MFARNSKTRLSGIIALVVALMAPPTGRAIAAGGDGQQEGIKVHGDWTIEIRDPDGTLVTRREFKNSLTSGNSFAGTSFLAGLLTNSIGVVQEWEVQLHGSPEQPCPTGFSIFPGPCRILRPTAGGNDANITKTLVVTTTGQALELSGTATAGLATSINSVATKVHTGGTNFANSFNFTSKTLSTPIAVAAGQMIQVKVVISFS